MIGTPSNLDLLNNSKLLARASHRATGGDLILAIRARDEATAESALAKAEILLERPTVGHTGTTTLRPRTLRSAQDQSARCKPCPDFSSGGLCCSRGAQGSPCWTERHAVQ